MRGRRAAARGRARRHRGAGPAGRPDLGPGPELRRDRRLPRAVRRPLLRPPVRRRRGRRPRREAGRGDGGDPGSAVLDPGGVRALRRPGLVAGQHDRSPRGGARPRDAPVLRRDRAGHRHGRRRRDGRGRRPGGGVRAVRAEPRPAARPARRHHRRRCPTRTAARARPGPTSSTRPTRSREGPGHRVCRLHRRRGLRRPRGRRPRGGPGRPDAPAGARPGRPTAGHPPARRARRRRRGGTCSTASTSSATRPRSSAPGVRVGDLPEYAAHNDLGTAALLAAMHEAGVARLVLASSMVVYGEGRYTCPEHGDQVPPPRSVGRARRRRLRQPLRRLRGTAGLGAGRRGRAARPAQRVRRQQGGPGALRLGVGPPGRSGRGGAALPQRLRAPHAAGHAVLRRRSDVPVVPRAWRATDGVRGRRADARLRPRLRRGRGEPRGRGRSWPAGSAPTTSAPASRSRSGPSPSWSPAAPAPTSRRRSPAATGWATCGTWSPRPSGPARSSASRPGCRPRRACASSRTRRCA